MKRQASKAGGIKRSRFKALPERAEKHEIKGLTSVYRSGLWYGTRTETAVPCSMWSAPGLTLFVDEIGDDFVHVEYSPKMPKPARAQFEGWLEKGLGWSALRGMLQASGKPYEQWSRWQARRDGERLTLLVRGDTVMKVDGGTQRAHGLLGLHWSVIRKDLDQVKPADIVHKHKTARKGIRQAVWEGAQALAFRCWAAAGDPEYVGCTPVWEAHKCAAWMRELSPHAIAAIGQECETRVLEWLTDADHVRPLDWYLEREPKPGEERVLKFATRCTFSGGWKVRSVQGTAEPSCAEVMARQFLSNDSVVIARARARVGDKRWLRPLELAAQIA